MESRLCTQCKTSFQIYHEDHRFYERFSVPPPDECPQCRLIKRLLARNPKNLCYRTCDLTGKRILSQYNTSKPFPVYGYEDWWGDSWDATNYGQDYYFDKPFFEQFVELSRKVPRLALFNTVGTLQNSEFNNCTAYLKNCYLIAESDYCEDCYYSNLLKKSKNLVDCSICYDSERLYECVDCMNSYNLIFSQECVNSSDSSFLFNCQSCKDCIGCINLRHKQYMIKNIQYAKEDYEKKKRELKLDTYTGMMKFYKECRDFFATAPHKSLQSEHNENSTGDHLFDSKNAFMCFDSKDLEDCRYCAKLSLGVKSSIDYNSWGDECELVYQSSSCGDHAYNIKFCINCLTNVRDLEYCIECFSSHDLFGCIGLKKKEYCILNKQYTKEEYFALRKRIIKHMGGHNDWGRFFPYEAYAFGYNESLAMDTFPLSRLEAEKKGYPWTEEGASQADHKNSQPPIIPDAISEVPDQITKELLLCIQCTKHYKIIPQELSCYRSISVPVPRMCPLCRHRARMARRNPLRLYTRTCTKCACEIVTSYAPERPETVYCAKCYLEMVY